VRRTPPQSCEHPSDGTVDGQGVRKCGRRATVEVRYLGDINFLCAKHHAEAQVHNTYQADELERAS
jgi:hypothetical protein